jgi:hypothetical protein
VNAGRNVGTLEFGIGLSTGIAINMVTASDSPGPSVGPDVQPQASTLPVIFKLLKQDSPPGVVGVPRLSATTLWRPPAED